MKSLKKITAAHFVFFKSWLLFAQIRAYIDSTSFVILKPLSLVVRTLESSSKGQDLGLKNRCQGLGYGPRSEDV